MSAYKPIISFFCLFALLWVNPLSVEGKHGNNTEPAAVLDSCRPEISGKHFSAYCMEETPTARRTAPRVSRGSCEGVTSLVYEERTFNLDCENNGFTGYFSPSNWMVSKTYGDGGVDVTGAPNALSVEGADNAVVNVTAGGTTRMQILIPTNGMVAFGWRNVGGSNLFSGEFRILVNDRVFAPVRQEQNRGRFRCPVRIGDQLMLEFSPRRSSTIEIDNFRLLSPATTIIERLWTATDEKGHSSKFTQFVSIEQPNISDILFPASIDNLSSEPGMTHPSITGYPYIDRDGSPATKDDRHYLVDVDACRFDVDYTDDLQQTPQGIFLYRHWVVHDPCRGNTMKETQVIRIISAPSSGQFPEDHLFQWPKEAPYNQLATPEYSSERRPGAPYTEELMTL